MGAGLLGCVSPTMRQEFFQSLNGMFGDAAEHVAEPDKRIDPDKFAGRNKAAQHGSSLAAVVAAEKRPVVPPHCKAPQRAFGGIVVDRQIAIGTVTSQRRPILQRISDSLSSLALGQHLLAN